MKLKHTAAKKSFKALAYPHMKLLYNMALRYCGNTFDAEDIVQETYLMAFNKFHQLRDKTKCKPWLLRILRNNFLKNYHKKKMQQKLSGTDYVDLLKHQMTPEDAESMLVKASGKKIINEAINRLPLKYKEALMLYYMDDLLYKDIAEVLEIPIGTVMSRLTRARERLKSILLKQMNHGKYNNILNIDFQHRETASGK